MMERFRNVAWNVSETHQRQRQIVTNSYYRFKRVAPGSVAEDRRIGESEMADDIHTLSRKIGAMHSELTATRKAVERLLAMHTERDTMDIGARTLADGRMFLPGTGTLGQHELGVEARAALDALDDKRPA